MGMRMAGYGDGSRLLACCQDGGPHLYERFLDRIVSNGLTDTVLPIKVQSTTGARMLQVLNYTVDGIYLDAAQVWHQGWASCMGEVMPRIVSSRCYQHWE